MARSCCSCCWSVHFMQLNQTVHLLHFTTTVTTCNNTAMSPHLVYLTNTSLEDTYHFLDNNAIIQMATCQFLTNGMDGVTQWTQHCMFTWNVDTCYYILTTCSNVTSSHMTCVDSPYHLACQAAKYMSRGDAIPMAGQTYDNCTQAGIFAKYTSWGNTA
jgi:hypothetical protein